MEVIHLVGTSCERIRNVSCGDHANYKRIMVSRTISPRKINIIFAWKTIIANKLPSLTCLRLKRTSPIVSLLSFNTFSPRLVSRVTVPQQRRLHSTFKPWLSQYNHIRHQSTMATARKVHLSPETDSGVFSSAVRQDTAQAASEALQLDMEKHHVFFNDKGYHSTNSDYSRTNSILS